MRQRRDTHFPDVASALLSQTADKLSLEVFPEPRPLSGSASTEALALAAVQQLMYPASDVGGDARLELPPPSRIKTEVKEIDGKVRGMQTAAAVCGGRGRPPAAATSGPFRSVLLPPGAACRRPQRLIMWHAPALPPPLQAYTYIAWNSSTTTRSGYEVRVLAGLSCACTWCIGLAAPRSPCCPPARLQGLPCCACLPLLPEPRSAAQTKKNFATRQVKRKNLAVAAARKGSLYVLGCSARSDQYDAAKEQTFQTIVESFRLL